MLPMISFHRLMGSTNAEWVAEADRKVSPEITRMSATSWVCDSAIGGPPGTGPLTIATGHRIWTAARHASLGIPI